MKGVPTLYYRVKSGVNPSARASQIGLKVCLFTESKLQRRSYEGAKLAEIRGRQRATVVSMVAESGGTGRFTVSAWLGRLREAR